MYTFLQRLVRKIPPLAVLMLAPLLVVAKPYKGAEVFTYDAELYGKYVIRMQAGKGSGLVSAFFLWKEGSELDDVFWEEVDIEVLGKDNATSWQSNIITGFDDKITTEEVHAVGQSLGDSYHTFTLEWRPDQVRWLLDGELVREVNGQQASDLVTEAQGRLNFWPANIAEWVGPIDESIFPVHMYVNWVEFHRWTGEDFDLAWRDDFDTFDDTRWGVADWTFAENAADFSPSNVNVRNGYLVLSMTLEGQEGYNGTPPEDTASEPAPEPEPPAPEPPAPEPPTPEPPAPGEAECNWYGTPYPLCTSTDSGWGWENNQSCISASTCSSQPAPYGIVGSEQPAPEPEPEPEPSPGPTPSPEPAPGEGGVSCEIGQVNEWGSGYQLDVVVTNETNQQINGWEIELAFDQDPQLTSSWSAEVSAEGASVFATGLAWNASLAPDASTTFGLQGNGSYSAPSCTVIAQ